MRALLLLALLSSPASADSLECAVQRKGVPIPLLLKQEIADDAAVAATKEANALKIGADATLSPTSFFLMIQDEAKLQRVSFSASAKALAAEPVSMGTGEAQISCRKKVDRLDNAFPFYPRTPAFLICALDAVKFQKGSAVASQRLDRKVSSTMLFGLPFTLQGGAGSVGYQLKYYRMDFRRGLEVKMIDAATGAQAHYAGPSAAMASSFLFGFTQGDRDQEATMLRLGCLFSDNPDELK